MKRKKKKKWKMKWSVGGIQKMIKKKWIAHEICEPNLEIFFEKR
jgi:hypothetical protein